MFQINRKVPNINVLLIGGSLDHSITSTPMLNKELTLPARGYGKRETYLRTAEVRSVRAKDGTLSSYRVYSLKGEA